MRNKTTMSETTDIAVPEATGSGGIAELIRQMLVQLGEDPNREGLKRTPERFEKALRFLTSGYAQEPEKLLNGAMFSVCYDEMVVVKDIEVYSLCEHHLLPFFGKCHVAYIPNKKVVGLSKIARLVNMYARRLQIQERLTSQIAQTIEDQLSPQGVGVIIEARHLVHGDARSGEAELGGGDQRDARRLPRKQTDPRRVPLAGSRRKILGGSLVRIQGDCAVPIAPRGIGLKGKCVR